MNTVFRKFDNLGPNKTVMTYPMKVRGFVEPDPKLHNQTVLTVET